MSEPRIDGSAARPEAISHLGLKAGLLLAALAVLMVASVLYLLYARGAFEPTQRLVLVADDSEGVVVGMDLTFSGFPIGRVESAARGPSLYQVIKVRPLVDFSSVEEVLVVLSRPTPAPAGPGGLP